MSFLCIVQFVGAFVLSGPEKLVELRVIRILRALLPQTLSALLKTILLVGLLNDDFLTRDKDKKSRRN